MKLPQRLKPSLLVVVLLLSTAALYLRGLGEAPINLGGDEVKFATHAYSLASTGRDLTGHVLPLFLNMTDPLIQNNSSNVWFQPMLFYLMAIALKVLPLAEWSIRTPAALIGVLDVFLIYAIARRLFPSAWEALLAGALLAITPAHFIFSRVAADYICSLPFLLGWLWCLIRFQETGLAWFPLAAGMLLGVGFYSYVAAWVMMPLYLILTWIAISRQRSERLLSCVAAGAGFAVPLMFLLLWQWHDPSMFRDTLARYEILPTGGVVPHGTLLDRFTLSGVQPRISLYWDYFNPAYLFFSGASNVMDSTRRSGVFLYAVAVFLVYGIYALWKQRGVGLNGVLLAGWFSAPLAAVVIKEPYCSDRELFILPFGVLISVFGVGFLLRQRRTIVHVATALLLLSMPVQFASFHHEYMTDYRVRVAWWFDPFEFRQIAEYVVAADLSESVPAVYLSQNMEYLNYGAYRWKFYMLKHRRDDLWQRTGYLTPDRRDVTRMPSGTMLVLAGNDPLLVTFLESGRCSLVKEVTGAAGAKASVILRVRA